MSRIVDYTDRTSCILFGDGSGAAVVAVDAPRGQFLGGTLGADGSGADTMRVYASGSRRQMDQEALDQGLHLLRLRGNEVFKFAVQTFRSLLENQLREHEVQLEDLGLVIPHQVNFRIIESALKKLDIPDSRIFMNLEKYGNTSAASVGIALSEAFEQGRLEEGKLVSLVAFGAGLTWASALLRW
jgi:3-oxoacyl-[acyl-carrier-protein] synthase-3